jgi:tetratricopeptide (TPR) repeat protein
VIVELRQVRSLAALVTLVVAQPGASALAAQRQASVPRVMIPVLRSQDKTLGVQAADALRNRMSGDFPQRVLWVIAKDDITKTLEASGYPTTEALNPNDAKALGQLLRADYYLDGTISRDGAGLKADIKLVLTRDNSLQQPLPAATGAKPGDLASPISRAFRDAIKQLEFDQKCTNALRDGKPQDAMRFAREGIGAYPDATIARTCLMFAYSAAKLPQDSILGIAAEIIQRDPMSKPALGFAGDAYLQKGDTLKAVETYTTLLGTDPNNTRLIDQVVNLLGAIRRPEVALPIMARVVNDNPGDVSLTRTYWLLLLAARDYKKGTEVGLQLPQLDTAAADSNWHAKMVAAFDQDSNFQASAEMAGRAAAKYPRSAFWRLLHGQQLRKVGQNQQALAKFREAIERDPKVPNARLLIAQLENDAGNHDGVMAALRDAAANGEDKAVVAGFALGIGNRLRVQADSLPAGSTPAQKREALARAVPFLEFSDSVNTTPNAKFVLGVVQFTTAISALQEAQPAKSCELARLAEAQMQEAQINVPAGGRTSPQAAQQVMGNIQQFLPAASQMVKAYCR